MGLFNLENKGAEPVSVRDKALICMFCGHPRFVQRRVQLHTGLRTFFSLEWTNRRAKCFVCEHCGFIHWFLPGE